MAMRMFQGKKGQQIFLGIMVAVMAFIVTVQFIDPLKDQVVSARSPTNLDCTNTSISVGQKGTCIVVDSMLPYFIAACIAVGIGYITMRKYVQFVQ